MESTITFVTIASKRYWLGFAALVESIRQNSGLALSNYKFIAYSSEPIPPFLEKWADAREEDIEFRVGCELNDWVSRAPQSLDRLHESFKKIALFGMSDAGTALHIFIDSDIICLNSITDIFEFQAFAGVGYLSDHRSYAPWTQYPHQDHINGGLFLFKPSTKDRDSLMSLYNQNPENYTLFADQDLLADWIARGQPVNIMPTEWNCLKGIVVPVSGRLDTGLLKRVKFLHFTGTNPWDNPSDLPLSEGRFIQIERLWWNYFEASRINQHAPTTFKLSRSTLYRRYFTARKTFLKKRGSRIVNRFTRKNGTN